MNPPKCDGLDYIGFLAASQRASTCTEAARSQPAANDTPAHDSFTRLLQRLPQDTEALRSEAKRLVDKSKGALTLDDTTIDKPYAENMEYLPLERQASSCGGGNKPDNAGVVRRKPPCAHPSPHFRLYNPSIDDLTKNDHPTEALTKAKQRGFRVSHALFDSWHSSLKTPKTVRDCG